MGVFSDRLVTHQSDGVLSWVPVGVGCGCVGVVNAGVV